MARRILSIDFLVRKEQTTPKMKFKITDSRYELLLKIFCPVQILRISPDVREICARRIRWETFRRPDKRLLNCVYLDSLLQF